MRFYIYIIQNTTNNKIYVGQTRNHKDRWRQHNYDCFTKLGAGRLYNSMRKYGSKNFRFTIIEEHTINTIDDAEKFWIEFFRSWDDSYGYNIEKGGSLNKIVSAETRRKLGKSMRGKHHSDESKFKNRVSHLGKIHTQEARDKMSVSKSGKRLSRKHREAISHGHIGISIYHTEETKQKMSKTRRGEDNVKAKLTETDVIYIITCIKNGMTDVVIAAKYNVKRNAIWKIRNGTSWKHISRD